MGWKFNKVTMTIPYRSMETHTGYVWGPGEDKLIAEIVNSADGVIGGLEAGTNRVALPSCPDGHTDDDDGVWCCGNRVKVIRDFLCSLDIQEVVDSEMRANHEYKGDGEDPFPFYEWLGFVLGEVVGSAINLLQKQKPMDDYLKRHFPETWAHYDYIGYNDDEPTTLARVREMLGEFLGNESTDEDPAAKALRAEWRVMGVHLQEGRSQ